MTKLERGLLITVVTMLMIVWSVACAIAIDASDVIQPMKPDVASEPLERVPKPAYSSEDKDIEEVVHELTEVSRGVVEDVESTDIPMVEEVVEEPMYFDISLDHDLQDHLRELCDAYGVDIAVILAMIEKESNFDIYAIGDNGRALGLMQIHPRWHSARMAKLESWDLMDPYQNLTVAVDFIAELAASGNSIEWVLMAYNGGEAYADRKAAAGEVSDYAVEVLAGAESYRYE